MNREALPLLVGIIVPIVIVALIVLYIKGYDFTALLRNIHPIYYVVLIPFGLCFIAALLWFRKPKN